MAKLLFCTALLFLTSLISATAEVTSKPLNFAYNAIDGTSVDLAQMRGKVVLIFFWATWSKPSRDDIPTIINVRKKYKDQGFEVLGVNCDSSREALDAYLNEYNMPWPEAFDGRGDQNEIAQAMKVKQLPSIWLVGKNGHVLSINANGDLDAQVAKALKMPAK